MMAKQRPKHDGVLINRHYWQFIFVCW